MNWSGAGLESRKNLLSTIQKKCKPTEMLETNRLEVIIYIYIEINKLNILEIVEVSSFILNNYL